MLSYFVVASSSVMMFGKRPPSARFCAALRGSAVLISESNYSDAHLFPWTYRHLVRPEHRAMLLVDTDPAALLDRMSTCNVPVVDKWIKPSQT